MFGFIAAIVATVAGAVTALVGSKKASERANEANQKAWEQQYQAQQEENEKARQFNKAEAELAWQRSRPVNQMAEYQDAGLNPNLVYGNISPAQYQATTATATQVPAMAAYQGYDVGAALSGTFNDLSKLSLAFDEYREQRKLNSSDIQKRDAEAKIAEQQAQQEAIHTQEMQAKVPGIQKRQEATDTALQLGNDKLAADIDKTKADKVKTEAETDFVQANKEVIEQTKTNLETTNQLLQAQIDVMKADKNLKNLSLRQMKESHNANMKQAAATLESTLLENQRLRWDNEVYTQIRDANLTKAQQEVALKQAEVEWQKIESDFKGKIYDKELNWYDVDKIFDKVIRGAETASHIIQSVKSMKLADVQVKTAQQNARTNARRVSLEEQKYSDKY
nr:pilot protein for DNA ejection [Microvirus sp.]